MSQLGKDKNSTSAGQAAGGLSSSFIGTSTSISVAAVFVTRTHNPGMYQVSLGCSPVRLCGQENESKQVMKYFVSSLCIFKISINKHLFS